jgi:hypothetical protein
MTPNRPRGRPRSEEHLNTEREFPSDKSIAAMTAGSLGSSPFGLHSLGFFSVHTILDVRPGLTVPPGRHRWLAPRRVEAARSTIQTRTTPI